MTINGSTKAENGAAERRGDDTHWWKAYQLHSAVALALKAHGKIRPAGDAALSQADLAPHRQTETEIHRAANKAIDSSREPRDQVDAAGC